ncbi:polyubiquitin containing 7 ubiquitin monomer, partial [Tanacetum coccineum]
CLQYTYSTNDDYDPNNQPPELGFFKLFVWRLTTGDTFTFFVHKYLSIHDLQWMIFQEEDPPPPFCQTLFFTGIKLDNKKSTLASYNICGESTIDLFIDHGGLLKLSIQTMSGKTIYLEDVFRDYIISKIKAMIQEKEGIHSKRQKLAYAGELLDDSLTLANYCIQKGSTFLLLLVDDDDTLITKDRELLIYIFIEATEKTIDLKVKSSATVRDVKAMIQDEEDIPAHQQTLFLPKKQLKDGLTLDQYYLPNNSTLHLVQTVG